MRVGKSKPQVGATARLTPARSLVGEAHAPAAAEVDPHADQMRMPGEIGRNHFAFDVACIEQGRDRGIGRHGLGQNQLAAAGILQCTHGLPGRRTEIIELIVERRGQGRAPVNADPKAERVCRLTRAQAEAPDRERSGPPPPRR